MQRKAKAAIIGSIAGTAMVTGVWFAFPASAHETNAQSQAGNPCPSGNTTNARQQGRNSRCAGSGVAPSGSAAPTASSTAAPTQSATTAPTATATATAAPTSSSSTSSCTTATGSAATIVSPGVGTVTVTIKVCDGVLSTSTGVISQSNWNANTAALASLNTLAVQYYASDMSKITYSGATLTANAYQSSLESALSKAGL